MFGDISIPGMDKDMKNALERGARGVENLMGSQASFHGVSQPKKILKVQLFLNLILPKFHIKDNTV